MLSHPVSSFWSYPSSAEGVAHLPVDAQDSEHSCSECLQIGLVSENLGLSKVCSKTFCPPGAMPLHHFSLMKTGQVPAALKW